MTKEKVLGIFFIIVSFIVSGCSDSTKALQANSNISSIEEKSILCFIANEDNEYLGDLYYQKGSGEKEKISSDVSKGFFELLSSKDAVIFLDKEDKLYFKEHGKERELISSESTYYYTVLDDESGVVFLNEDNDLYIRRWKREKEKIASDVIFYEIIDNGNIVAYRDNDYNFYIKKDGEERQKIASNVNYFIPSYDGEIFYFLNGDQDLYMRYMSKPDNFKITSGEITNIQISTDGKTVTYLNEYNYEKQKGEFYSVNGEESPEKIASDVSSYHICDGKDLIYYLNSERNLLSVEQEKDEKTKIAEEVLSFLSSNDGDLIVYENKDNILYLQKKGKEKERIGADVEKWDMVNDSVVYLTKDKSLYIKRAGKEKKEIATDVEEYMLSRFKKTIAYYTSEAKFYINTIGGNTEEIVENTDDFTSIWFSNALLFEKKLKISDIRGIWHNLYYEEAFVEITDDDILKIYENGELLGETKVAMDEYSSLNYGTLIAENLIGDYDSYDEDLYLSVEYHNKDEITIDSTAFMRIDKKEFDEIIEETRKAMEEQTLLEEKIDRSLEISDHILYTYQVIISEEAVLYEYAEDYADRVGVLNQYEEYYIDRTYVDENGDLWCYIETYDENGDYMSGWTKYSNF